MMNLLTMLGLMAICLCPVTAAEDCDNENENNFNFEISKHVTDEIKQLLEIGMRPVRVLYTAFSVTRLVDPHDFNGTRSLYYHLIQNFPEAQALYCSFEDGRQTAYVENNISIPLLYLVNGANCNWCRFGYDLDNNTGNPTTLATVQNYDARNRSWYIDAKAKYVTNGTKETWSSPLFFVVRNAPGVIFTMPVLLSNGVLDGLIALNYDLHDISEFLYKRYSNSTRTVFIVDDPTGYLLGSSVNATLAILEPPPAVMVRANESDNALIANAMRRFLQEEDPDKDVLLIADGQYIQAALYWDAPRNIKWRIVVVMPANLQADYVAASDSMGIGICVIATIALCISIAFIVLVFYYRNARIVKMSQVSFIGIFLFGCFFMNLSIFFSLGENTRDMCHLRAWFAPIMMAVAIAPLLCKTWWIYWLFTQPFSLPTKSDKMAPAERAQFVVTSMTARSALLVLIEIIILLISNLLNSPDPVEQIVVDSYGFYSSHVYCGEPSTAMTWVNNIYFAGLLFSACFLAFKARNINENLAESRSVAMAVYAVSLFALIVQIVRASQQLHIATDALLSAVGFAWGTSVSTLVVLGPRFLKLFTMGDEAACAWLSAGRKQPSQHLSVQSHNTDTPSVTST